MLMNQVFFIFLPKLFLSLWSYHLAPLCNFKIIQSLITQSNDQDDLQNQLQSIFIQLSYQYLDHIILTLMSQSEIQEAKTFCMATQNDTLAAFKQSRIKKIAQLLPPKENFTTGPQSSPFSLLEDLIILVCSNFYGRLELFGRDSDQMQGSCQTLPFWEKVIDYLKIRRSADALRSRYTRIVSQVHPREYDQYIELMTKDQLDSEIKYSKHPDRQFMLIRKISDKDYYEGLTQFSPPNSNSRKKKLFCDPEEITQIQRKKDEKHKRVNISSSKYLGADFRYITNEFFEEKEVMEQLVKNPKYIDQRSIVYDWIETGVITLTKLKQEINNEINQVAKDIEELEDFKKKVKFNQIPQKIPLEDPTSSISIVQEKQVKPQIVKQEMKQEMNIFGVLANVIDLDDENEFQKYL